MNWSFSRSFPHEASWLSHCWRQNERSALASQGILTQLCEGEIVLKGKGGGGLIFCARKLCL